MPRQKNYQDRIIDFIFFVIEVVAFFFLIGLLGYGAEYVATEMSMEWMIGSLAALIVFSIKKAEHRIMEKIREQNERL
jgi:hypothetical protein